MRSADTGAVWSVLDAAGTQNMMRSTLGEAAALADFDTVKKSACWAPLTPWTSPTASSSTSAC